MRTLRPMWCFAGPHAFVYILCHASTQQYATFLGSARPGGELWPPNSNSAKIFVRCIYPQVSSSYVYLFGSYPVDTHINPHTWPQTNRFRWKHPTFFATLRGLVTICMNITRQLLLFFDRNWVGPGQTTARELYSDCWRTRWLPRMASSPCISNGLQTAFYAVYKYLTYLLYMY